MVYVVPTNINPEHLADFPALRPPSGIIPNFIDPYTRGPIIVIVGSILIAIMTIFVVGRIYTNMCIHRKLQWGDCRAPVGLQFLIQC